MRNAAKTRGLYEVAERQGGYFTAKQAAEHGYTASKRTYHVQAGNWVREQRGIYRLKLFPEPARPDLIQWWLWTRGRDDAPPGVFSHRTALSLHELTDANPAKVDITVPPGFRKSAETPAVLRLHFGVVTSGEVEQIQEVPVTAALRSLADVWREGSAETGQLREAFREAMRRGLVRKSEVDSMRREPDGVEFLHALEAGG